MKVVITGGSAGGATAAARLRRLDEKAEIVIFQQSGYISYASCGLPYYIGDVITDKQQLTLQNPDSFWDRYRIDALVHHRVLEIDRAGHKVKVENLISGKVYYESYDYLLLSTGSKPAVPAFELCEGCYTVRTVEDAEKIKQAVKDNGCKSAVVIGGGFIGIEMAENLCVRGLEVTVIEYGGDILTTFDSDMSQIIQRKLVENNITLKVNTKVTKAENKDGKINISTSAGNYSCDIVICAVGIVPDTALAVNAGLETGIAGSIITDSFLRTSDPDIYAVGDAVQVKQYVSGNAAVIPLAGPANKQGRIAADNIAGIKSEYKGSIGSSVIKLFDTTAAAVGLNSAAAKAAGIDFDYIILSPLSHAGYYPGAEISHIKILFEKKTGRIIGGQIVGDMADKRIDVLSAVIKFGGSAKDLCELQLCYAPPYSAAKDPLNMAGYIIENLMAGLVQQYHPEDFPEMYRKLETEDAFLLDTRTEEEYNAGHVPGFVNIPLDDLRERFDELPRCCSVMIYVICQSGMRSYLACRILSQYGYNCCHFAGGYRYYSIINGENPANSALPCGKDRK